MKNYIQIQTTTETENNANKIATALIESKVAACVQIVGPITSHYIWKNRKEESTEFLCLIKSREELYQKIESIIFENHPYENPEIISTPIQTGSKLYLGWIDDQIE